MDILRHPNPALKQRAEEVDPARDPGLRDLVRTMAESMYGDAGVGLAAPQIGVVKRILIFDVDDDLVAICNPVIVEKSDDTTTEEEGCLSCPGVSAPIERYRAVVCEGVSIDGSPVRVAAEDLLARVLQHEIDHLDGVLIFDRVAPELRRATIRQYNEANDL